MRLSALALVLLAPIAAHADENAQTAAPVTRLFGHLPYGEASPTALAPVPSLAGCMLVREAVQDLERLLAAARAEGIELGAISCFRSIAQQRRVFCAGAENCDTVAGAALRARFVGPPGHSEHATGYAVDFVQRGTDCRVTEQCFLLTPGGKWLMRRGPDFGFELSFPQARGWRSLRSPRASAPRRCIFTSSFPRSAESSRPPLSCSVRSVF